MDANTEIENAMAQAVEDIKALRQKIAEAKVPDDQVWFRNFLFGILNCALTDYKSVEIGAKKLSELAAWGRRNLLELKVITEYLLRSEETASELRNDLILDAKEFYESVSRHHKATHKQYLTALSEVADQAGPMKAAFDQVLQRETKLGPQTAESDSEAHMFQQFQASMGLKGNARPKTSGELASLLGTNQWDEFTPLNKICSKIMHRTVFSIASNTVQGSLDAIIPFLKDSATSDLLLIYSQIKRHMETEGIQVPPKKTPPVAPKVRPKKRKIR